MFCNLHGKPYHGRHHRNGDSEQFVCVCSSWRPGLNSPTPCKRFIYGTILDKAVWKRATEILMEPETILGELERRRQVQSVTEESVSDDLARVERKLEGNRKAETNFVYQMAHDADTEIYSRVMAKFKAERTWCLEEKERLERQLAAVGRALSPLSK
jgi:hypothetical protein